MTFRWPQLFHSYLLLITILVGALFKMINYPFSHLLRLGQRGASTASHEYMRSADEGTVNYNYYLFIIIMCLSVMTGVLIVIVHVFIALHFRSE